MTRLNSRWIKNFLEIERTEGNDLLFRYTDIRGHDKPRPKDQRMNSRFIDDKAQKRLWKTLRKRELSTLNFSPLLKDFLAWLVA